jgi:hypothetical protein
MEHAKHMEELRNAYKVWLEKRKGQPGRRRYKYVDNIIMDLK